MVLEFDLVGAGEGSLRSLSQKFSKTVRSVTRVLFSQTLTLSPTMRMKKVFHCPALFVSKPDGRWRWRLLFQREPEPWF